jgi:hypothetical protein
VSNYLRHAHIFTHAWHGLPVVGMGSEVEHNRRQLEMQPVQQAAQGQA